MAIKSWTLEEFCSDKTIKTQTIACQKLGIGQPSLCNALKRKRNITVYYDGKKYWSTETRPFPAK